MYWQGLQSGPRIALIHDFAPPPTGGGHQFLRALWREWEREGIGVAANAVPRTVEALLFNSCNFTPALLDAATRRAGRVPVVHRVDGPLQTYRGFDDGADARIAGYNRKYANASVFQSAFSRGESERLGLNLRPGPILPNAADPAIFRARPNLPPPSDRPLRVIATSWSDNPHKGLQVFRWLDEHLDPQLAEVTFVGASRRTCGTSDTFRPARARTSPRSCATTMSSSPPARMTPAPIRSPKPSPWACRSPSGRAGATRSW